MAFVVTCSQCGARASVQENAVGRRFRCPACKAIFVVPQPSPSPAAPAATFPSASNQQPTKKTPTTPAPSVTAAPHTTARDTAETPKASTPVITLDCPSCLGSFDYPGSVAGQRVACRGCGQKLWAPDSAVTEKAAPSVPAPPVPVSSVPASSVPVPPAPRPTPPPIQQAPVSSSPTAAQPAAEEDNLPRGSAWKHSLAGVAVLLLVLGFALRDAVSNIPKDIEVVIHEEPQVERPATPAPPVFVVQIEDDQVEQVAGKQAVTFRIEDEEPQYAPQAKDAPVKVSIEDVAPEGGGGRKTLAPIDATPRIRYDYHDPSMHFGITALRDRLGQGLNKLITYSRQGITNNTRVMLDGNDHEYGDIIASIGGRVGVNRNNATRWLAQNQKLADDPEAETFDGSMSMLDMNGILISQIVDVVPSEQPEDVGGTLKRLLDTVRVRYIIKNSGTRPRTVGLRAHVDTLIGSNDGVPFMVPQLGLVTTTANFNTPKQVPPFIQALEYSNLRNPGLVAHMTFHMGGNIESPSQVLLTHWPGMNARWQVPVRSLQGDSAVIMYWAPRQLAVNATREVGYAYGLGGVTADEGEGKLGISLAGSFDPGKSFVVTAYVSRPVAGQVATLEVPPGLRVLGEPSLKIPAPRPGTDTSVVSWNTQVLETGRFRVRVKTNNGLEQAKDITVARSEPVRGGRVKVDLKGDFEPGKSFNVFARVEEPQPGQSLALKLPEGLELAAFSPARQNVPAGPNPALDWSVKVIKPGKHRLEVASSTGVTYTKIITIEQAANVAGRFDLNMFGEFQPQKTFTVAAHVKNPAPGQTLTLQLPAGLTRVGGEEISKVTAGMGDIRWQVRIEQSGTFPIRVSSSTGVVQRKTLTIGQRASSGGAFTIEFEGAIEPGKEFLVRAQVKDPAAGQSLTLALPEQVELVAPAAKQTVSMPAQANQPSAVEWRVRVLEVGRLPFRVESSTGMVRTKTIVLGQKTGTGRIFGQ